MKQFTKVTPESEHYKHTRQLHKNKPIIDYKNLANQITDAENGEVFEIEVRDRGLYSNIKRALLKRRLVYGVDYDLAYRTIGEKKIIFVTVTK